MLKINPGDYYANQNLGIAYLRLRRYDEAELYLKKVCDHGRKAAVACRELAQVYFLTGDNERGLRYLNKAYAMDTYDWITLKRMAEMYESMGDMEKSRIYYEKSHRLNRESLSR